MIDSLLGYVVFLALTLNSSSELQYHSDNDELSVAFKCFQLNKLILSKLMLLHHILQSLYPKDANSPSRMVVSLECHCI